MRGLERRSEDLAIFSVVDGKVVDVVHVGLSPRGPRRQRNFMQIINGNITGINDTPAPVRRRRVVVVVVVLLLRFTLLRTLPRDDPLCVLPATRNVALQRRRR